jgi:lipoprotein signal peptidase
MGPKSCFIIRLGKESQAYHKNQEFMLKGKIMILHFSPRKFYHKYYTSIFIFLLFSLDQATKILIQATVPLDNILFSIYGFGITFKINRGLVLHLFEQYESTIVVSIIHKILIILIGTLAYRFYKILFHSNKLLKSSFVLMMSGVFGNLCDKIFLGYARDFILWPGPGTPNLADIFIIVGLICLITELLRNPQIENKWEFSLASLKNDYIGLKKFISFAKREIKSLLKR